VLEFQTTLPPLNRLFSSLIDPKRAQNVLEVHQKRCRLKARHPTGNPGVLAA
jgi:hypothetical protein